MSASAAARGLSGIAFTGAVFRQAGGGERARVRSVAHILRRSGYTIAQLSISTGRLYGDRSSHFIPPTFLYKLRSGVTPHICQIVALSQSTGYRFVDWMHILGFGLQQIPRLQVQLHAGRTTLITPIEFESPSFRPWLSSSNSTGFQAVRGGSRLSMRVRLGENLRTEDGRYCFAKIGQHDALISRKLFADMIVRVDRSCRRPPDDCDSRSLQQLLWLVEHPGGLACSHLRWIGQDQVVLQPSRPPLGSLPLCLSREGRVLGLVVDLDPAATRLEPPQFRGRPMKWQHSFASSSPAPSSPPASEKVSFSALLRAARARTGLTFRAAHELTKAIARISGNPDYAIGLGPLSDYETMNRLPRHVAKIISLCIVYCIDIRQLLEAAGVYVDDSTKMPLPAIDYMLPFEMSFLNDEEQYRTTGLTVGSRAGAQAYERVTRI
jgi:hypothetical protein